MQAVKPEGFDEWQKQARELVEKNPDVFHTMKHAEGEFVSLDTRSPPDPRYQEWDGEKVVSPELEGTRSEAEKGNLGQEMRDSLQNRSRSTDGSIVWKPEPMLTAEQ